MWCKRVRKFVIDNGGNISVTNPALFIWHENKNLIGAIYVHVVHVDDFLCSGNEFFFNHTIFKLRATFSFGKEENDCFRSTGLY